MNRKKIVILSAVLGGVVLLLAGALVAWLVFSVDGIVKREIERAGTETTGTSVTVGGVNVRLKEGSGRIDRLRIDNPRGFSPAAVIDAEGITFDIDLATLREEVLVVDEVKISKPRLRFEISQAGKANVDAIAQHAEAQGAAAPAEAPRKIRIKRFVIENGGVDADASAVQGKEESFELRDIVLTNVGGRDGGTSEEISAEIIAAVRKEVTRTVMKEGYRRYLAGQEEGLKEKAKEKLKGLFGK